jgi:hypothetical protein
MENDLKDRIAANEATFRDVNEGIARGQWPGEGDEPRGFRCECARLGCNDLIEISPRDYERIRSHPRRFVLAAGHQVPDVEIVVETGDGYVVVEKTGEAGRRAEEADPRS